MSWNTLLADLENRFEAERRADLLAEAADLAEAETASVALVDRLRAAVPGRVWLRTTAGLVVDGHLEAAGPHVLLVDEGNGGEALVPVAHVALVSALPGPAAPADPRRSRAGLAAALRELRSRGARVRVAVAGTEVVGQVLRVAADHVDIALDAGDTAPIGAGLPRALRRVSLALDAIQVVRSR